MTPHERYQRGIDLVGEIKQAEGLVEECRRAETIALQAYRLAQQATERQVEVRQAKYDEARKLADESRQHFLAMIPEPGEPAPAPEQNEFTAVWRENLLYSEGGQA